MADVNPTVTVEQHGMLAASWSPAVTYFPTTMTMQAKAAVLKCPLCAKRRASDKLHISPPGSPKQRVQEQQKLASW